jgi:hypothetical protein
MVEMPLLRPPGFGGQAGTYDTINKKSATPTIRGAVEFCGGDAGNRTRVQCVKHVFILLWTFYPPVPNGTFGRESLFQQEKEQEKKERVNA